jgi:hypothetical protein
MPKEKRKGRAGRIGKAGKRERVKMKTLKFETSWI